MFVTSMLGQSSGIAVDFPIELADVATGISTAGAAVLVLAFSVGIGFMLVKKLKRRIAGSV